MKLPVDDRFRDEERTFGLVRSCEDCALWDDARDRCAHGYPTREHRRAATDGPDAALVFCKDFEAA